MVTSQLTLHESIKLKAIGNALHEVLNNVSDANETELLTLIEQRRASLLNSIMAQAALIPTEQEKRWTGEFG